MARLKKATAPSDGSDPFEDQKSIDGKACVTMSEAGQAQIRNIPAATAIYAAATNFITFTTAAKQFDFTVPATGSLTRVLVVYGPTDTTEAAAWLADAGTLSTDVQYDWLLPGQKFTRKLTAGVTKIAVLPVGADTALHVVAV